MITKYTAYHGTTADRVDSILRAGVLPSMNADDWLGQGSYFFIGDLSDPKVCAINWVTCATWNRPVLTLQEDKIAIIEVVLSAQAHQVFDLREMGKVREFHRLRREFIGRNYPGALGLSTRPEGRTYDAAILDELKVHLGISIVISNFHIQLSARERFFRLDSRIPNVTVLCVSSYGECSIQPQITRVEIVDRPTGNYEENSWKMP